MNDIVKQIAMLVEYNAQLEQENRHLKATRVNAERFYTVPIGLSVAGQMHNTSPRVLRRLISLGVLSTHPASTDSKILLRASTVMSMNIDELKQEAKHITDKNRY